MGLFKEKIDYSKLVKVFLEYIENYDLKINVQDSSIDYVRLTDELFPKLMNGDKFAEIFAKIFDENWRLQMLSSDLKNVFVHKMADILIEKHKKDCILGLNDDEMNDLIREGIRDKVRQTGGDL